MTVRIYSTDTDDGQLTVVDQEGKGRYLRVCEIAVGNAPRGSLKITGDGRGFVSNCGGNTISEIDLFNNREIARIEVGIAPRGIGLVAGERFALVSNSGSNTVSVVDLHRRMEIEQVSVGRDPRHMATLPDGSAAYICIWGSDYVAKLDTSGLVCDPPNPRLVREVVKIPVGKGAHPYSAALSPESRYLIVANTQVPYVSVIDCEKDEVVHRVDVGHKGPRAAVFSPDGRFAFVSLEDTSEVVVVDMDSFTVTRRWPVGPGPRGITMDPNSMTLYSSGFARTQRAARGDFEFHPNTLTVLEIGESMTVEESLPTLNEIPVGNGPCSVVLTDWPLVK